MSRIKEIIELRDQNVILAFARSFGVQSTKVERFTMEFASRKPEEGEDYYYYSGPLDEKTRAFCKKMLKLDKVFSSTDIDILSNYLNYSVAKYKGSYNCRHSWVKFRGKIISTPEPTVGQIRELISKGIKAK